MNNVILNDGQEEASKKIIDYLHGKTDKLYFTLSGGPGTGKSFMLKETIRRSGIPLGTVSCAAVSHAAKNVLEAFFHGTVACYTVAQWLGHKLIYNEDGTIDFKPSPRAAKAIRTCKVAILDEASMINDELYDNIIKEVTDNNLKLIVLGDVHQLPPVKQDHDSKFFDSIDVILTEPMRFTGPIATLSSVYKDAITHINNGYSGNIYALNEGTNRINSWDSNLNSGYKFMNNVHDLVAQVADEIKLHPNNMNFSRMLAFKNNSVNILNTAVRDNIYGKTKDQFEENEIIICNEGYSINNKSIIYNGQILEVSNVKEIIGPHDIPCLSLKFKDFRPINDVTIPVVQNTPEALKKYALIKNNLRANALRDPKQWGHYHKFNNSFAYFSYAYSVSLYKAQGQTLNNVYVFEGEVMGVKPLTLKQKYQALYVAMTRATNALYIYNKDY